MALKAATEAVARGSNFGIRRLFCIASTSSTPSFLNLPPTSLSPDCVNVLPRTIIWLSVFFAARVVTDRVSGYSKGFGFVRYATIEDTSKGIEGMDGKFLDSWVIFAEYARPRPPTNVPGNNMAPQYGSY